MLKVFDYDRMPIGEVVNEIFLDSSKKRASDIHFDPQEDFLKVRIRIDGELIDYTHVPNNIKKNITTKLKLLAGMNITESRLPQDGAIKETIKDVPLDMRVSCLPTNMGEKIVIRILDYSKSLTGIEELGFSEDNYRRILHMIGVPNGIILVTGATGSGKSTTVYSILQRLNQEDVNIITVEDPIEMDIKGINQVQTQSEIGLDFATALRSILRQDPNIIMIGEMRDTETAKIGVRASITGHLVLSTIHTNNSLDTIERLLDMDVERYLLSSALTGIVSQKLARTLCPDCKKIRKITPYEKELVKKVLNKDIDEVYDVVGCENCTNGYHGRIAIHEVLLINQDIRDAISNNIRKAELRKLVYTGDVTTMLQDGLIKVSQGHTTFEEILKLVELDSEDSKTGVQINLETAIEEAQIANVRPCMDIEIKEELTVNKDKVERIISNDEKDLNNNCYNNEELTEDIDSLKIIVPDSINLNDDTDLSEVNQLPDKIQDLDLNKDIETIEEIESLELEPEQEIIEELFIN